jgi:hypothetical protein
MRHYWLEPPRANTQRVQQSLKVCAFVHRNSFDPKGTIFIERIFASLRLADQLRQLAMVAAILHAAT